MEKQGSKQVVVKQDENEEVEVERVAAQEIAVTVNSCAKVNWSRYDIIKWSRNDEAMEMLDSPLTPKENTTSQVRPDHRKSFHTRKRFHTRKKSRHFNNIENTRTKYSKLP